MIDETICYELSLEKQYLLRTWWVFYTVIGSQHEQLPSILQFSKLQIEVLANVPC